MPHVVVNLVPGKSEEQKTRLAEEITKDIMNGNKTLVPFMPVALPWQTDVINRSGEY
jgi:hypothetical protein